MKKILGLDIGTNSIGAALIKMPKSIDDFGKEGEIEWLGSRIIPVDGEYLQKFETGAQGITKAAARRMKRGSRRLKHRYKLRRTRLTTALKLIGWLSEDFPLDNPQRIKNIIRENNGRFVFRMKDWLPFSEQTIDEATELLGVKGKTNEKGNPIIQEDWIIYYLRKKALTKKITVKELARILFMMNQRRGFKSSRKDLQDNELLSYEEFAALKAKIDNGELPEYKRGEGQERKTRFVSNTIITKVQLKSDEKDKKGKLTFEIEAADNRIQQPWEVKRKEKPDWEGKEVKLLVEQKINRKGEVKQDSDPKQPKEDDWTLMMTALDNQIDESGKQVGEFFWDKLVENSLRNEIYKIRQNVVRREKYQKELDAIWKRQIEIRKADGTIEELLNSDKVKAIAETLYKNNSAKQKELIEKGLFHIIANDIIYYQRDLKSQKGSISECRYEKRTGKEKNENGEWEKTGTYGLKCAPKSSPLFQEFRIWQDIHNIRILQREQSVNGTLKIDADVTRLYLNEDNKAALFDLFDSQAEITEKKIFDKLNELNPDAELNEERFRINLFTNNRKSLKGNETKEEFRKIFRKFNWEEKGNEILNNPERFFDLWHILYSISSSDFEKSKKGIQTALKKRFSEMPAEVIEALSVQKEFKKDYAAYSAKALKKLLTVMRCGEYWKWEDITNTEIKTPESSIENPVKIKLSERIDDIIKNGWERDIKVDKRTGEIIEQRKFRERSQFSGLPVWMAGYVVYGRHSERENSEKYTAEQIRNLNVMNLIEPNSLRNPMVEQVVRETVLLVKDICNSFGQPDEIHIELGRDLKKNAEQRAAIAESNAKNLEEKLRAKKLLSELMNGDFTHYDEHENQINASFTVKPNPDSPVDIEKFRIYKSCGWFEYDEKEKKNKDQIWMDNLFRDGKRERIPSNAEVKKYILWLSQRCMSPYTGKVIPLSKLFDENSYQKEHIIPQARMKNDAMVNLVIAEAGVNKAKGNRLAANFIADSKGSCEHGNVKYPLLNYEDYVNHCKKTFRGRKLKNLLATEVPDDFIERQINDTRYIGKKLGELLYPFAKEKEGLLFTIGSITSELKGKWGLNKVWKRLLEPRFKRLEQLNGKTYIYPNQQGANDIDFNVPEIPDFDSKRLDHRHHALDALIIAATTREHIRYLNTLNAADTSQEWKQYQRTLCKKKIREFLPPWETFTHDAKEKLSEVIVTFKTNNRVISRPFNRYMKWVRKQDGTPVKQAILQQPNKRWMAVRRSMFKVPQGIIWIKNKRDVKVKEAFRIQIERMQVEHDKEKRKTTAYVYDQTARPLMKEIIEKTMEITGISLNETELLLKAIEKEYLKKNKEDNAYRIGNQKYEKITIAEFIPYKAKRVTIDKTFDEKKISKIPYADKSRIPVLLKQHLKEFGSKEEAFSTEGLEKLAKKNQNKPIRTITVMDGELKEEHRDNLFGNKYIETDAGAIAYFVIYENETTKERSGFISMPAHKIVERLKQGLPVAEKREGCKTILLQPNDLVYVPTDEEWKRIKQGEQNVIDWNNRKAINERIYKMVKSTGKQCFFIPSNISRLILPYDSYEGNAKFGELESQNCSENTFDGAIQIKQRCIKLRTDRLGNIQPL
ncbi:MAG TPA: HNH endonuclease domain-containing protein [Chitinophagales bacterium]|nr:HNH endonuclease domain-containing protein [Chitinophagales bacterium]